MELTPGERQILSQLRELYSSTSQREHSLGTITSQWPAMHVEAYRGVLRGLVAKGLLEQTREGQAVRITDAGMRAMGVRSQQRQILRKQRLSPIGRLVFVAAALAALVLIWLVLWPR